MNFEDINSILSTNVPMTDITIGNVLIAVLILIIGYLIVALVVRYIRHAMNKANMAHLLVEFVSRVAKILLLLVILLVAVSALGIDVGAGLVSISVVFGFVIGFAFQDMLGNLAAGFMIALTKPFKVGDFVDAAGNSGSIQHVGISNTTMLTYDNKKVIIPNSKVWGDAITNYTAMKTRMIDLTVGIGYDDDIGKAMKIASDIINGHEKVLSDPAPMVATNELGDSSVNLIVRPWVKTSDYWAVKRGLTKRIKEAFDEAGINIPYPQTDVHLFKQE
ncbi:MAG: mechanosensitive ion channel family protein [Candidatus Thermoplasmatota archaeon]|nr:mechanosensitive ion channel family protein [Candidatus Thermoplasmatota archaeon]